MKFSVQHETAYSYTLPVNYSIQQLRLTPRLEPHQRVLSWDIDAPGRLRQFVDAYGNVTHTLVLTAPHNRIRIALRGALEIEPLVNGRLPVASDTPGTDLSPLVYTIATPLTAVDETVRAFAARNLKESKRSADFVALAEAI